jgi:hypothetical protein
VNLLVWRLHRNQVYWASGALVTLGILLVVTGLVMSHDFHTFFATCGATTTCDQAGSDLFRGDGAIIDLVNATLVVPLLFGLFWAAPLVAKEYEDGTQNLVWSQGVTRRHWLTSNVIWVFVAAVLWSGILTSLVSWWRAPENALDARFTAFDIQGIVPIAYAIFAVGLGLALGSIFRRVLPAIATTLGVFVAIRLVVAIYVRPHFIAPIAKVFPSPFSSSGAPPGAWVLSSGLVGPHGHAYGAAFPIALIPRPCQSSSAGGKGVSLHCLVSHGFGELITYQPASRFWAFQGIEAALFVALAGVLVAIAYWMVLRRDA